jgi:hypothetical protein
MATDQNKDRCWNCDRERGAIPGLQDLAVVMNANPLMGLPNRNAATAVALGGGLLFLLGLVRFNSFASQVVRGMGGTDGLSVLLLLAGAGLALWGGHALYESRPDAPNGPAPLKENTTPQSDRISQLERLAALKERGLLSADEFDAQKRQLLS